MCRAAYSSALRQAGCIDACRPKTRSSPSIPGASGSVPACPRRTGVHRHGRCRSACIATSSDRKRKCTTPASACPRTAASASPCARVSSWSLPKTKRHNSSHAPCGSPRPRSMPRRAVPPTASCSATNVSPPSRSSSRASTPTRTCHPRSSTPSSVPWLARYASGAHAAPSSGARWSSTWPPSDRTPRRRP